MAQNSMSIHEPRSSRHLTRQEGLGRCKVYHLLLQYWPRYQQCQPAGTVFIPYHSSRRPRPVNNHRVHPSSRLRPGEYTLHTGHHKEYSLGRDATTAHIKSQTMDTLSSTGFPLESQSLVDRRATRLQSTFAYLQSPPTPHQNLESKSFPPSSFSSSLFSLLRQSRILSCRIAD
jgi:hypothetical protein